MKPSFPLEPVGGEGLLPTGKHGGRDSIKLKVFEEDGGGLEGEGETFCRRGERPHVSPSSSNLPERLAPPLSSSKTFDWWGGCAAEARSGVGRVRIARIKVHNVT